MGRNERCANIKCVIAVFDDDKRIKGAVCLNLDFKEEEIGERFAPRSI